MKGIRLSLFGLAAVMLVSATWGGLVRIGWGLDAFRPATISEHGPLMVIGFLGTLISLERAVAMRKPWAYAAPALAAASGAWVLAGGPIEVASVLSLLAGLLFLAVAAVLLQADGRPWMLAMAIGALMWPVGAGLMVTGEAFAHVVPWFGGFVVFTIAGERLELSRMRRLPRAAGVAFWVAATVMCAGTGLSAVVGDAGWRVFGLGLLALALWLAVFDIARMRFGAEGLPRFIAVALYAGYAWLAVAGVLWMLWEADPPIGGYDAMIHTLFVGFVFSMIFAHAPIIVPAVLGAAVGWSPGFYAHLGLLHLGLVIRVAGDISETFALARWGALLNALAMLLFAFDTAMATFAPRRPARA